MCGIVAAIAKDDIVPTLLNGLTKLEYRGYDSAGFAALTSDQNIYRLRAIGEIDNLRQKLASESISSQIGIAHARWATHGKATENNAHPHCSSDRIAIVHNGIIENYQELRQQMQQLGYQFQSDTDSEVIAHLIHAELQHNPILHQAVRQAANRLHGSYALAVIDTQQPDRIITLRHASPLVIGIGKNANYLASDQLALLAETKDFIFLHDDDLAEIFADKVIIYDAKQQIVQREIKHSQLTEQSSELGDYQHFMLKEIFQQPQAIAETIQKFDSEIVKKFTAVKHIQIVACGTSFHAALVAKYWLENLAQLPCSVDIASEFCYRNTVTRDNSLLITISQSGETADTLAALRKAKKLPFLSSLAICNVAGSSLTRESEHSILTHAGPEIGVASTKAFTTQLTVLLLLTLHLTKLQQQKDIAPQLLALRTLPDIIQNILLTENQITTIAKLFKDVQQTLFLGRSIQFPIACEGALKLKEISYIHAQAYPAGELKHGPLALIDTETLIVANVPQDRLIEKLQTNLQAVTSRGGQLVLFKDERVQLAHDKQPHSIDIPEMPELLMPIAYTVPLQLLAYHVAVLKGTNVDKPRNLAKSVTVE